MFLQIHMQSKIYQFPGAKKADLVYHSTFIIRYPTPMWV